MAEQVANTFAIVRATDRFSERRANINTFQFRTLALLLFMRNGICNDKFFKHAIVDDLSNR
jgi:hypothetical protein